MNGGAFAARDSAQCDSERRRGAAAARVDLQTPRKGQDGRGRRGGSARGECRGGEDSPPREVLLEWREELWTEGARGRARGGAAFPVRGWRWRVDPASVKVRGAGC